MPTATAVWCALHPAGNVGGEEELAAVRRMAASILLSCEGFADFVADVEQRHSRKVRQAAAAAAEGAAEGAKGGAATAAEGAAAAEGGEVVSLRLGDSLTAAVRALDPLDWMVPPMLQAR